MPGSLKSSYSSIHQSRLAYIMAKINNLNLKPSAKVLDVGCYPPLIFNRLSSRFTTWGLASPHEPLNHPKIKMANLDSDRLPFKSASFDLIIFSEVLEHLYCRVPVVLSKLHRLLAPGGSMLVTTPNATSLISLSKMLLGLNPAFPLSDLVKDNPKTGSIYHRHNREYTAAELAQLLSSAGFKIQTSSTFVAYTPTRPHLKAKSFSHRLASWFVFLVTFLIPSRRDSLFFLVTK